MQNLSSQNVWKVLFVQQPKPAQRNTNRTDPKEVLASANECATGEKLANERTGVIVWANKDAAPHWKQRYQSTGRPALTTVADQSEVKAARD